ncbi:peptide chain release factor N(5)-glutamine methyltransferase [Parahaliea aestuarii]|uniref:Release factor glutamine methyltransferase n=1 Tax=Parahaliea aestuarii TaxID=1852021 RepID=A0A5C9A204_9GAMM|nr:peptide chain release factor N(5)-glutamine methyltransferase [Parahaliea aestuarii]TXS94875.1 peptide chain release factor N(5)-glutamine methyltransferase [Parahaliea aestuarii]
MASVRELLALGADLPTESPTRDAEVLLCHCLQRDRTWLYTWPEKHVEATAEQLYRRLLARRLRGEPVAHLTGNRDFWTLSLKVTADTLIPRPDTETLVSWALELPLPARARALDLGTGSGAIALALATENPGWQVTATDASAPALAVAQVNIERYCPGRVRTLQGDWYAPLAGEHFDLIVSNPPYIEADDEHLGCGDVRFEPRSALVAGATGLDDLQVIIAGAVEHLAPGGFLLLEHGYRQGLTVRSLLLQAGFSEVATRRDLGGNQRVSGGRRRAD